MRVNQRAPRDGRCTIIQNATIWFGRGGTLGSIVLSHGLIQGILEARTADPSSNCAGFARDKIDILDAQGRIVTPGLVDMHSHMGMSPWPYLRGSDDVNEVGTDTAPYLRSLDAFDPSDNGIRLILAGGVTSALVIPGSANLIGGEGFVFKTAAPESNLAEDMLVQANLTEDSAAATGAPLRRWMKMACGENALRTYSSATGMPTRTRMGSAFHMRSVLSQAAELLRSQDAWCTEARERFRNVATGCNHENFPTSIELDTLVGVLRGSVDVHWHCYLTHDIETQLRIAREFNFSIAAFHHALDLYRGTAALRRWKAEGRPEIGAAIFSDMWGYKREAYTASKHAPSRLLAENITFAFKSDHPVLNSQYLAYHAGRSLQYGLDADVAMRAITSNPAKLLKLDHRIGKIDVGMDADVVIWNNPRSPFIIGALPTHVYVDGKLALESKNVERVRFGDAPAARDFATLKQKLAVGQGRKILFKNISMLYEWRKSVKRNQEILVDQTGRIMCVAKTCPDEPGALALDMSDSVITPSLVLAATNLGLQEIEQEQESGDGPAWVRDAAVGVFAADGLGPGGRMEREAVEQGIGLAISVPKMAPPAANPPVLTFGVAALFATGRRVAPSVFNRNVAVYVDMRTATDGPTISFSSRMALLRQEIRVAPSGSPLGRVRSRELPLLIRVDAANRMLALLNLQREATQNRPSDWPPKKRARWIFVGAAEAHLIAKELGAADAGVLLAPPRCVPATWGSRRCLGILDPELHAARVLRTHGVKFAISTVAERGSDASNLRFEGGWARRLAGLNTSEMIDLVTGDVLDLFGLDAEEHASLRIGRPANFNAWTGDPGEIGSHLIFGYDATRTEEPFFSGPE